MKLNFYKFLSGKSGATAVEYALVAAGIGMVVFGALSVLGGDMSSIFTSLSDALD